MSEAPFNLSRFIASARRRMEAYVDPHERHIQLLKELNELTGSTFSAFNLCDELGRMIGGTAWPLTPEKERLIPELTPKLHAIISLEDMQSFFVGGGLGRVKVMPQPLYRSSALYQEVYRHLGMEYMAWYFYPRFDNGDTVIVGISSGERDFDARALRLFDRFCKEFETEIATLTPAGERLPVVTPRAEDHIATLTEAFGLAAPLSDYLRAAFLVFYGGDCDESDSLPSALSEEIAALRAERSVGHIPTSSRDMISWHRRKRGRQLNLLIEPAGAGYRLQCHEDYTASRRLQRIKEACEGLKRDGASVFATAQALLDGVKGDAEILKAANLQALKDSSARRILSKARSIVGAV